MRRHPLMGVLLALLLAAPPAGGQAKSPTVLALYDGGREFSSIQLMDRALESTLHQALGERVTLFREYMDLTRISAPNYEHLLREFYRSKYASNVPDVIVAVRGRPLEFLLGDGDALFPNTPIVSSGMDKRQVSARKLPPHVTGATLNVTYWPTLTLARTLQPELNHVAVLFGSSRNDHTLEALVREEFKEHEDQLRFTYLSGLSLEAALQEVSRLPSRSAVLFVTFAQDREGKSFLPTDAVRMIARAANAPTYVNSEDVLGAGAVGGNLISFTSLGRDTALAAVRAIEGDRASATPFIESSTRVNTLDARELERWSIPMTRVPAGSVLLNRVPTLWEAYGWRIAVGIVVLTLQSVSIAMLLIHHRRRRTAEASLLASEGRRHTAVMDERNRMARDMHDTLAQGFTGVIVQLQAAEHALVHGSASDADAHIHRASDLARQGLGEARRSIRGLRPEALESGHLCAALESMLEYVTAGTTLKSEFIVRGEPRALTAVAEENLFRIHQEILTNSLKHARATTLQVTVSFDEEALRLLVQDDGGGFDPKSKHDGLGLLGIRERVRQLGGEVSMETRIGTGTSTSIVLPFGPKLFDADRRLTESMLARDSLVTAGQSRVREPL